ncbi:hypothetical protein [Lentzea cavernae]|uniref:Uncharacterized protein n=1 Tax=Lentzea cavernae TaxID=2020703 RepID=A0ABQ3LXY0_9PSEU|nr:hypothetical protein [Lentzea cavernae]GHH28885.1 hypothetical protein GCM10017774_03810 [Lentzea cavernae]
MGAGDSRTGADVGHVVVLVEGQELPLAVVRVTGAVEEAFTHDLRWEPSALLSRVPTEPAWTARDVDADQAAGFLVEMVREVRARSHESELADHKYYASFRQAADVLDLARADRLLRRPDGAVEEEYAGHETWEPSTKLSRVDSGKDPDETYIALSLVEAAQVKKLVDEQWDRGCTHHVVLVDGSPVAVVTKVVDDPDSEFGELAFTGDPEPQPSRLLAQATREPRMTAVQTSMATAVETMARLSLRWRGKARQGQTAAHAVFYRLTDVLDLGSAHAVVPEPLPENEFSVPLATAEAAELTARLRIRDARRGAEPIDGHHHFAVFVRLDQVVDLDAAHSLIRVDGSGRWEVLQRDGRWLATAEPRELITLPLNGSEVRGVAAVICPHNLKTI